MIRAPAPEGLAAGDKVMARRAVQSDDALRAFSLMGRLNSGFFTNTLAIVYK